MTTFDDLNLVKPLARAVAEEGYAKPTPIQAKAIPHLLAGRDVLGMAQTGTGKTAAFALPILQRLAADTRRAEPGRPRALVLTPTRELAVQVGQCFATYGRHLRLRHAVIHGGVSAGPQTATLRRGVDVVVATPGRCQDLMRQGHLVLDRVGIFVLDEADRMLDMGFIHAVRQIASALPKQRQTLLFSATLPNTVQGLVDRLMHDYERVEAAPVASTAERIEQRVLFVNQTDKNRLLMDLLSGPGVSRAIIFTRTKRGADRLSKHLAQSGLKAAAIHGNKTQSARQKTLASFRSGTLRALVATDIAARGIDVDGVTHVINYDLPNEPESYVHRIGRTARAGARGIALSFCNGDEVPYLKAIEKTIRALVPVDHSHPFHADAIARLHIRRPKPT